jgi:DNA-binding transcriptional MerR regulator
MAPNAEGARLAFRKLVKTGYLLQTVMGLAGGAIASLGSGFVSLISVGAAAVQGLGVVAASFVQLRVAAFVASFALKGVSQAVAQATGSAGSFGMSLAEIRKQLNELKHDSKEAALSQERAALNLEKAREAVQRVQDLPPNSRARREAQLALAEAEQAYARAKDRAIDLQDQVEKGVVPGSAGGADPYAGLTESQEKFARFLVSIQPEIDKLREKVASAFLGPLETQIGRIVDKVFPMLEEKLPLVAGAFGTAAEKFTDAIVKQENIDQLGRILEGMVPSIENWGTIFGNVYEIALDIAEALNPVVELFTKDLINATEGWRKKIDEMNKSGELTAMFERGYGVLSRVSGIIGNVLGGLGNIIDLNFGEGGKGGGWVILDWLDKTTEKFQNLGKESPQAKKDLQDFFEGAATNATVILDTIGAYIDEIFKLADNPKIAETFEIIKSAAPQFGELLAKGLEAAPSFGELVVTLIDMANALSDTGAMQIFFETLTDLAKIATDFFKSELGQSIMQVSGRLLAFGLAIGAAFGPIKFIFNAIVGNLIFFSNALSTVTGIMGGVQTFFLKIVLAGAKMGGMLGNIVGLFGRFGMFLGGPWGIAIGLAVTALTWFFTQTDVGKEMFQGFLDFLGGIWTGITDGWNGLVEGISAALAGFGQFFQDTWNGLTAFFQPLVDGFAVAFDTAWGIIKGILDVISAVFLIIFIGIGTAVQGVWDGIKTAFDTMWGLLKPVVQGVKAFFEPIFKGIGDFVKGIWTGIQTGFQKFVDWIKPPLDKVYGFFKTVFGDVKNFIRTTVNTMIGYAEGFVNFFIRGLNNIIDGINKIKLKVPDIMKPLFGGKSEIGFSINRVSEISLPRLAKGGTVFPSSGGSIVNVAEAGRPERIEPLDPNGLSKRDRALIQELTGGAGSGITVNVYPSAGMDEKELAQLVSRELAFKLRRGGY